ncbi:hypothetical protein N0V90_006044 [Kalmusia sp. IMI 367209]|nr:hypothetical protein N0V90_006044 [Kalmusia sp. IMI 367209]
MKTSLLTLLLAKQLALSLAGTIDLSKMNAHRPFVSFDELPLHEGDPPYSAWGLYGDDDELGRINLITSEVTKKASKEIRSGETVPLKKTSVVQMKQIELESKVSSALDDPVATLTNFISDIANHPIATRGVLLDYVEYAAARNISYDAFTSHTISHEILQEIADEHGIRFQTGDVLLVRSGWYLQYAALNETEQLSLSNREGDRRTHVGVKATIAAARWQWEHGFAAVAGDTVAYESMPLGGGGDGTKLHEIFLSGWAMPIGESFDLEKLAKRCKEQGRYTFFFTSQPLNLPGGVASPPNAMAVF